VLERYERIEPSTGATDPDDDGTFGIPGRTRLPLTTYCARMEEKNARLHAMEQETFVLEEVVAGNLYTGPMYLKYNAVLRSFSGVAFLIEQCVKYKLGESTDEAGRFSLAPTRYATTIYAINSLIVKGSKLTVVTPVFRGVAAMRLPQTMLTPNEDGVSGGVEYGFSSATRELKTARFYAKTSKADVASTVLEVQMGQIDRGCDLGWASQFPHEAEVLVSDARPACAAHRSSV
jgi:hypothetical protein